MNKKRGMEIMSENWEKRELKYSQNSNEIAESGSVFLMQLLMKEECRMPEKECMMEIMKKYVGDIECFCYDEKVAGFSAKDYLVEFEEGTVPPQLMVTSCVRSGLDKIDEAQKSQMWNCCDDRDQILSECKYQVLATDMLATGLSAHERADLLMDYMEALVEMYPECEAVYFQNSGKLFLAKEIRNHEVPRENRFIYFAVNVRFFNVSGTEDMVIDTLGMKTLSMPDLQYHFHGLEPDLVANHAYNYASYIYDNNNPIKDGNTVDGIYDEVISRNVQWKCHYENSIVQPSRDVIDICMNEYASGNRTAQ